MIFEQDVCDFIDSFEPKLCPADYIFINSKALWMRQGYSQAIKALSNPLRIIGYRNKELQEIREEIYKDDKRELRFALCKNRNVLAIVNKEKIEDETCNNIGYTQ